MWACRYGYNVCGKAYLGWATMGRILKDQSSTPLPPHLLFCFCNFFHFVPLCPNTKQPRLSIGHLQNENDCHVSYISIYLIAIQSPIRDNVLPTHLSYAIPLDHHLILSAQVPKEQESA